MNIIINEYQQKIFERQSLDPQKSEKIKKIEDEKAKLEDFIEHNGEYMTDITNGKKYLVQYLRALSDLVGKRYAMCAPVRNDGTYGAFYVKPFDTFQKMFGNGMQSGELTPTKIKPNLYQRLGLNK